MLEALYMTGQLTASRVGITGKNIPWLFVSHEGKHPLAAIRLRRGTAGVKYFPVAAPQRVRAACRLGRGTSHV